MSIVVLTPEEIKAKADEQAERRRFHLEHMEHVSRDPDAPSTHVLASGPHPVAKLPRGMVPQHYLEALEQNQQIAHCCRHPENHHLVSFKSHPREAPDIFVFICTCGRRHVRFCIGGNDVRPVWEIR